MRWSGKRVSRQLTYPLEVPNIGHQSWTKWSCWIHTWTGVLDLERRKWFNTTTNNELEIWMDALTAAKWPAVIERPIANGADPLTSERRSSQTPCTTKTNMNVISASIMTPWIGSKFLFNKVFPNTPFKILAGVAN